MEEGLDDADQVTQAKVAVGDHAFHLPQEETQQQLRPADLRNVNLGGRGSISHLVSNASLPYCTYSSMVGFRVEQPTHCWELI